MVGVPVVAMNPSPNFNDAVFMATLATAPLKNPPAPVATPNPVAVMALFCGMIAQRYEPVAPVAVTCTATSTVMLSTAAVCVPIDWDTSAVSAVVPFTPRYMTIWNVPVPAAV